LTLTREIDGDAREPKAPMPGVDHSTIKARHARAVDLLAAKLRVLPPPCAATLRRIGELSRRRD